MQLYSNDRNFIVGRTGSGKSFFVKNLLKSFKRYIIYDTNSEYSNFGFVVKDHKKIKDAMKKYQRVVFQPDVLSTPIFEYVCDLVYQSSNCLFVAEEIQNYASLYLMPPNFQKIITMGRKRGIGFVGTSQRPALVNPTVRTQCENIFAFACHPIDAKSFEKIIMQWERIPKLQDFSYMAFSVRNSDIEIIDKNGNVVERCQ